ncbi:hypothetical protein PFISCL1PPCAC_5494, partial [Pristionchus fissidentatus]
GGSSRAATEKRVNQVLSESQKQEREANQQHLNRLLEQQKANEAAKIRDMEQFQQPIREAQERSDRRERDLTEERRQMERQFNDQISNRENSSQEERLKMTADFNERVKVRIILLSIDGNFRPEKEFSEEIRRIYEERVAQ